MALNLGNALEFGISGFKDKKARTLFFYMLAINIIAGLVIGFLFAPFLNIDTTGELGFEIIMQAIYAIGISMIVLSIASLLGLFLGAKILIVALEKIKVKPKKLTLMKFVRLLLLYVAGFIVAGLSLFRPKYLLVLVASVVLIALGVIQTNYFLLALGVIASLGYLIVFTYNSLRIAFGEAIFLSREKGIIESLKESDNKTKGKLIELFIALIIINFISWVISAVFEAVGSSIVSLPDLYPVSVVFSLAAWPIITIIGSFYYVELFRALLKPKK